MIRLLRPSVIAPLLGAGGTLLLLAAGMASLWRSHAEQELVRASRHDDSANVGQPSQSAESAPNRSGMFEPRRLPPAAEIAPAAFVFGPPPIGSAEAATDAKPQSVEPAPSTPWYSGGKTGQSPEFDDRATPNLDEAGMHLNGPAIAPPGNDPSAGGRVNDSVLRRLTPVEEAFERDASQTEPQTQSLLDRGFTTDAPAITRQGAIEPRRLPPVDDGAPDDATFFRLAPVEQTVPQETHAGDASPQGSTFEPLQLDGQPSHPELRQGVPSSDPQAEPSARDRYTPDPALRLRRLPEIPAEFFAPTPPTFENAAPAPHAPPPDGAGPSLPPDVAPLPRLASHDPALAAVSRQAMEMVQYGFSLAHRGATYSARAQFIQALRTIAQALDAAEGSELHGESLAQGLRALEEADDFAPRGSQLEADLNLKSIIASHRTTVLKDQPAPSALEALQRYYTYAQNRLASAGGGMPAASMALYALGKLHTAPKDPTPQERRMNDPKALALHHAALLVDSRNYEAANELGVLLARYGQLHDARGVLLHGLSLHPTPAMWHNLSVVHERLGEVDLARRARYEQQLAERQAPGDPLATNLRWVPPAEFARMSPSADPSLDGALPASR